MIKDNVVKQDAVVFTAMIGYEVKQRDEARTIFHMMREKVVQDTITYNAM